MSLILLNYLNIIMTILFKSIISQRYNNKFDLYDNITINENMTRIQDVLYYGRKHAVLVSYFCFMYNNLFPILLLLEILGL